MTLQKSIGSYLGIFVLAFIGLTVLVGIIGQFLSSSMTGMTVVVPFISASIAGSRFLKVENRLPTEAERKSLTNGCFFIFVGINLLILGLAAISGIFADLSGSGAVSILIFVIGSLLLFLFLISYFMIRWAFGGLLNKQAKKALKDDTTFD